MRSASRQGDALLCKERQINSVNGLNLYCPIKVLELKTLIYDTSYSYSHQPMSMPEDIAFNPENVQKHRPIEH